MRARSLLITAGLALAPAIPVLAATPAHALTTGHLACVDASGNVVIDPPDPSNYVYCVFRAGQVTTIGGGPKPVLCTVNSDGSVTGCTPIKPIQG